MSPSCHPCQLTSEIIKANLIILSGGIKSENDSGFFYHLQKIRHALSLPLIQPVAKMERIIFF